MQHPKFWSLSKQVAAVAAAVGVALALVVLVQVMRDRSWHDVATTTAPIAAAGVAVLSLVVTATSVVANWRRQRREATIQAWSAWSDASAVHRRALSQYFGLTALTEAQGRALVEGGKVPGAPKITTWEDRRDANRALVSVLNGLERLAVGVEMGVYDLATLRRLGGTIVVRHWERSEQYVIARREARREQVRQKKVYQSLELVCTLLADQQLRDDKRRIDRERLAILRNR